MELEGIVEEAERSFSYRNTSLEDVGLSREIITEKYRDTALKQVKRHLILGKIIEQEKLARERGRGRCGHAEDGRQASSSPWRRSGATTGKIRKRWITSSMPCSKRRRPKLIMDSSAIEDVEPQTAS